MTCSAIPRVRPAVRSQLDCLLLDLPSARLTDEGRSRVSHSQDVNRAHVWPEDSTSLEAHAAEWVHLLDSGVD
jgi:hypothetical protein